MFETYTESSRFKEDLDEYNHNTAEKVEYSTSEIPTSRQKVFTLRGSPSEIAKIIEQHGSREVNSKSSANSRVIRNSN